ncbi:hypothetical protein F5B18DRAFT_516886 [Nemania serpens]|nr:hypothetical protein F5B18DRAFT_516886 [Nemania serpens]
MVVVTVFLLVSLLGYLPVCLLARSTVWIARGRQPASLPYDSRRAGNDIRWPLLSPSRECNAGCRNGTNRSVGRWLRWTQ